MKKNESNLLENILCPICKAKNYKILKKSTFNFDKYNFEKEINFFNSSSNHKLSQQLVECLKCELIYVNPRISSDIINKSYSYNEDIKFIDQNNERIESFKINLNRIINAISFQNKKFSILDVGSGGGAFIQSINSSFIDCDGIEPNEWLVNQAKKYYGNVNLYPTTLSSFIKNKKYELITYWDVFEHLTDINNEMFYINKFLKKDSYLILNIPDYGSIFRKLLRYNWPFFLDVHLYYFNRKTIELFMKKNQFKLIKKLKHVQILKLGFILKKAINFFPLLKIFNPIIRICSLDNLKIKYNVGQSIYIFKKQ